MFIPKCGGKMIQSLTFAYFFQMAWGWKTTTQNSWGENSHSGVKSQILAAWRPSCLCSRSKSPAHWVPKASKILGTTYSHCDWSPRMLNIFRSRDLRVQVFRGIGVGSRFRGWMKQGKKLMGKSTCVYEVFGSIFSWVCFLSLLDWVYFLSLVDYYW